MNRKTIVKIAIAVVVLAGLVFLLGKLPVKEYLDRFDGYVAKLGTAGMALFVVGYVIAALLFPASVLTLGAGAIFGPWIGTALVSVASTACACLAFLIGRYGARAWVERRLAAFPKFKAVEGAVSKQGFKIVLLTRLSPAFPYTWMNYAYGITSVSFRSYALASWIGMLPGTFLYVYLGYAAKATAGAAGGGGALWLTIVKLAAFIVPTAIVTVIVTRIARKALAEASAPAATA